METKFEYYNILLTPSSAMFKQSLVTMLSAMLNCKKPCHFYILQFDWSGDQKHKCKDFVSLYPGNEVEIIWFNTDDLRGLPPWKGYLNTYFKIISHLYLPKYVDRVLYVDCDVIFNKDIDKYYSMDFDDNYIIASCETIPKKEFAKLYNTPQLHGFINGGVELLNTKKFRDNEMNADYFKDISDKLNNNHFADQGLVSYIFKDQILVLPSYKYNHLIFQLKGYAIIFAMSKDERRKTICSVFWDEDFDEQENATIIHYTGYVSKPWQCFPHIKDEKFEIDIPHLSHGLTKDDVESLYLKWWEIAKQLPLQWYEELFLDAVKAVYVTPEKNQNKWVTNAKNFLEALLYDFLEQAIFVRYIQSLHNKKVALLKSGDTAGRFLLHLLKQNKIEVVFQTQKTALTNLTNEEWLKCRSADVIICCCVHGTQPVEHDGIKPIMIWDILKEPALPASDYKGLVAYNDLAQTILAEIRLLKESAEKDASAQRSELNLLRTDNDRMSTELSKVNADLGRFSGENKQLIERLSAANKRSETLLQEHDSLNKTVVRLESEVSRLENDLSAASVQGRKLNADLSEASFKLEAANAEKQSLIGENKQLIERLNAAEIRSETLIKDQNSLNMTIARLESEVDHLEVDLNSVSALNDTLTIDLRGVSSDLEAANAQLELLNSEKDRLVLETQERDNAIKELQNKITEMEHSRSWRITKPLRAIMWFFRRLFGKVEK